MNLRYWTGLLISIPLLPFMYFQGKKIRQNVPELPEAKNPKGLVDNGFEKVYNLIFIGESTFAGVGVIDHKDGFAASFAAEYSALNNVNISWEVHAKSGYTLKRMRTKLLPKINQTKVDLILVGAGGNDAFTLNRPYKWRVHAIEMIHDLQVKFPETPIVFTNMPPIKMFPAFTALIRFVIGNLVEILGYELKDVVRKYDNVFYNSELINLKQWNNKVDHEVLPSDLFSDGVHPSKLTYKIWGKDMARFSSEIDMAVN